MKLEFKMSVIRLPDAFLAASFLPLAGGSTGIAALETTNATPATVTDVPDYPKGY